MIDTFSQLKGSSVPFFDIHSISEGTAVVCHIPKGYRSAIGISSDQLMGNREKSLMWLYKYGYKAVLYDDQNRSYSIDYYKTGIIDFGVYFPGTNATLVSQLTNNDFTLADPIINSITTVRGGKVPTVMAYGNGNDVYRNNLYTRFLSGRNSRFANNTRPIPLEGSRNATDTESMEYNTLVKEKMISRPISNRYDYYKNLTSVANLNALFVSGFDWQGDRDYLRKINTASVNGQIYTVFGHWHWLFGAGFKNYLTSIDSTITSKNVYKAQYVELMEYFYIRDSITSLSFNPQTFSIVVNYTKKNATQPYQNITTPLWIEVNLKSTSLQGSPIQTSVASEIIKKSADLYVIGVTLDYTLTSKSFTISSAADESGYSNQTVPVVSVNTTTKLITSNQPIRYTLFSKTKATLEENLNTIEEFNHTLNASPTIGVTLTTATKDYYLGFVNAFGISGVIQF